MYNNIGSKIKGLALASFVFGAIVSVISGIALMAITALTPMNDAVATNVSVVNIVYGLLLMILGPLVAWISSWLLYGFGELIDKTCDIANNTSINKRKYETQFKIEH